MSRTWKPTMAGILNVISGAFFIIGGIIILSLLGELRVATPWAIYTMYSMGLEGDPSISFVNTFIVILGAAVIILGVLSILGGIYSIKRRLWGIVLVGSVSTFISLFILGIPAIALTAVSKKEFV